MRGKPVWGDPSIGKYMDHPRGCGENLTMFVGFSGGKGSPPRMRGKPLRKVADDVCAGITPADAGKTFCLTGQNPPTEDHPRGCGENGYLTTLAAWMMGSPPRMRGKPHLIYGIALLSGITPADAGKTLKRSFRNQPFCSRAVQISFNFSNSLNVSLQSGSAR